MLLIIQMWRPERKGYAAGRLLCSPMSRRTTGARFWITTTWPSILRPVQP
jgi:hypothetical protein